MSAQRWRVALDGYLVPVGGGREREVYDEGDEVVLAADHERDVAAAEARGWNAAVEAVQERLLEPPASAGRGRQGPPGKYEIAGTIAALRKNTGRGADGEPQT